MTVAFVIKAAVSIRHSTFCLSSPTKYPSGDPQLAPTTHLQPPVHSDSSRPVSLYPRLLSFIYLFPPSLVNVIVAVAVSLLLSRCREPLVGSHV